MRFVILFAMMIPVLALSIASTRILPIKLIYNASESVPTGLYWVDHAYVARGDYVLVRVPESVRKLVEERRYLPPNIPLIKQVAGAEDDVICRQGREILIDNVTVAMARIRDGQDRLMPFWHGCHGGSRRQVDPVSGRR